MFGISNYDYRRIVPTDTNAYGDHREYPKSQSQRYTSQSLSTKSIFGGIGWMITTTLLIATLLILAPSSKFCELHTSAKDHASPSTDTPLPYAQTLKNCGSTRTEAKSPGCKFDILSFAWQLPECYDDQIMEELSAEKNWSFFRYVNGTSPVSREVALSGELDLHVTLEYHRVHCMYMWRQMHRAFTVKRHIDSHLDDYHHTLHCNDVILREQYPLDWIMAFGKVKLPNCRKVF